MKDLNKNQTRELTIVGMTNFLLKKTSENCCFSFERRSSTI